MPTSLDSRLSKINVLLSTSSSGCLLYPSPFFKNPSAIERTEFWPRVAADVDDGKPIATDIYAQAVYPLSRDKTIGVFGSGCCIASVVSLEHVNTASPKATPTAHLRIAERSARGVHCCSVDICRIGSNLFTLFTATSNQNSYVHLFNLSPLVKREVDDSRAGPTTTEPVAVTYFNGVHARAVKFLPGSGGQVVVGMYGRQDNVVLADLETNIKVRVYEGHNTDVNCVAVSPCGRLVASGSDDATVAIFDVRVEKKVHVLALHSSRVWSIAINNNSMQLLSGSADGTVALSPIGIGSGKSFWRRTSNDGQVVRWVSFGGAADEIVGSSGDDGSAAVMDAVDGELLWRSERLKFGDVSAISFF